MIHVAVGVIHNRPGEILISKRHDHAHQGGLWEFPGGKVEPGETVETALKRELHEELGIQVAESTPLIQVRHRYDDRHVLLDVFEINDYRGQPHGREGQPLAWVSPENLKSYPFPAADRPILSAIRLPRFYAVLESAPDPETYRQRLQNLLQNGIRLIYWRARNLPRPVYQALAVEFFKLAETANATLMLRDNLQSPYPNTGLHLTGTQLNTLKKRPPASPVAAACHTLEELRLADNLQLDFAVLSPIQPTTTHPNASPLGWDTAKQWLEQVNLPVFLMGGLQRPDLRRARHLGAQGVAGIRLFQDQAG